MAPVPSPLPVPLLPVPETPPSLPADPSVTPPVTSLPPLLSQSGGLMKLMLLSEQSPDSPALPSRIDASTLMCAVYRRSIGSTTSTFIAICPPTAAAGGMNGSAKLSPSTGVSAAKGIHSSTSLVSSSVRAQ